MFTYDEAMDILESKGIPTDVTTDIGQYIDGLWAEYSNKNDAVTNANMTRILNKARKYVKEYTQFEDDPSEIVYYCESNDGDPRTGWVPFERDTKTKDIKRVKSFIRKETGKGFYVTVGTYDKGDAYLFNTLSETLYTPDNEVIELK